MEHWPVNFYEPIQGLHLLHQDMAADTVPYHKFFSGVETKRIVSL